MRRRIWTREETKQWYWITELQGSWQNALRIKTENEQRRLEKHDRQWSRNETLLTAEHTNLQPRTMWLSKMVKSPRDSGYLDCSLRTWRMMVIKSVLWASAAWSIAKMIVVLKYVTDIREQIIKRRAKKKEYNVVFENKNRNDDKESRLFGIGI